MNPDGRQENGGGDERHERGGGQEREVEGTFRIVRIGGDIIVRIDGQSVEGMDDLITYLETRQVGQQVVLTIVRGGDERQVEVTLEERPAR